LAKKRAGKKSKGKGRASLLACASNVGRATIGRRRLHRGVKRPQPRKHPQEAEGGGRRGRGVSFISTRTAERIKGRRWHRKSGEPWSIQEPPATKGRTPGAGGRRRLNQRKSLQTSSAENVHTSSMGQPGLTVKNYQKRRSSQRRGGGWLLFRKFLVLAPVRNCYPLRSAHAKNGKFAVRQKKKLFIMRPNNPPSISKK